MLFRSATACALGAFLLVPAGCSLEQTTQRPGETNRPIIGGVAADGAHHDSVVSLHYGGRSDIFCSGTLIADDVVLTAAHCLDEARGGPKFKTMSPSLLTVYVGDEPLSAEEPYADNNYQASETLIHPSYDRRRLLDDIALVRLATPVPNAVTAPALPAAEGFTSADVGVADNLNFAGFGYSDLEKTQIDVKLQTNGTLAALGCPSSLGCPSGYDSQEIQATQISYANNPTGPCNGDSGGPAFINRDGVWYVGGITSYGDSGCDVYGASTRADAYEGWIDEFVNPPAAVCGDGTCNGDEDCSTCESDCGTCPVEPVCGDGTCDAGEDAASCPADCDSGGTCSGSNGYCTSDSDCCSGKCRLNGSKANTCT